MREAIVAVFDTVPHTEDAVRALQSAGIDAGAIRRYRKGDPMIPRGDATGAFRETVTEEEPHRSSGGFWSWLIGGETTADVYQSGYERDYPAYTQAIESGKTVLAVTVEESEAPRVMDVLDARSPLELEDTGPVAGSADLAPRTTAAAPVRATREAEGEEHIPLAEEELAVGKRRVDRGTTRIHRYVVETPVEQQVNLQDERVEIERRRPMTSSAPGPHAFEERTVEVRETTEEPVVSKKAAVREEVVVRKETTEHPETVRDTLRKEEVKIESPRQH